MRAHLLGLALLPRLQAHCPKSRSAATKRLLRLRAAQSGVAPAESDGAAAFLKEREQRCTTECTASEDDEARTAVRLLASASREVRLGVAAAQQQEAVKSLGEWVRALDLTKGLLHGADVDGEPLEIIGNVFIKYASACGSATLRKDTDDRTPPGVLFYPLVGDEDDAAKQYLLPLALFSRPSLSGRDARCLRAHAVRGDVTEFKLGKDGCSQGALAELDLVLEANELVKVKTGAGKKKAARALAEHEAAPALDRPGRPCYVAQVVGHTALLYRRCAGKAVVGLESLKKSDPNDLLG